MPQCFQLFLKNDDQNKPVSLSGVDEEICKHLNLPVHNVRYCCNWFDTIGWDIAVKSLELGSQELRESIKNYEEKRLLKILDFLETKYKSASFYENKSHPKT